MIIACPACATRYEVPERAVGPDGRTVRCAKCRHSWFVEPGGDVELPADAALGDEDIGPGSADEVLEPPREGGAHLGEGADFASEVRGPDVEQGAPEPVFPEEETVEEGSTADAAPPVPRRSRWRLWAWAAVIIVVLGGATAVAASYWGLPDWVPVQRATLAASRPGLKLDFPADQQERRQLPNGTEFFGASGTITNVDSEAQPVPPLLIVLRDSRDRIVFSWEVAPPRRRLAPGESITVNEAMTDVPRSARVAEIGWKPV